jgi:hypothetical protein
VEVEEACKKRKYTKDNPIITMTEDDVEFIIEKV